MRSVSCSFVVTCLFLVILAALVPVSAAMVTGDKTVPSINLSVTPTSPVVGDIVTISGTAKGGNLTPGVRLWIFAGNYVNVTSVPVDSAGNFRKAINTSGYPPAYYYLFVQHPGSDNKFNINITGYSGEVVDENTGAVIFNFTGNGSLQDTAAAAALSKALNEHGVDDLFAKSGVTLRAPGGTGPASGSGGPVLQATLVAGNASQTTAAPGTSPAIAPVTSQSVPVTPDNAATRPGTTRAPLSAELLVVSLIAMIVLLGPGKRS